MARDPFGLQRSATPDPAMVEREVRRFLDEDVGPGDITTARVVPAGATARARIVARETCVVAGLDTARAVFGALDKAVAVLSCSTDGSRVTAGTALATVDGPAAPILTGERIALNLLQRLCGIATITRRYVDAIAGTGATVSDTRKTTPGLRALEKYAVHVGGGRNHRMGLYDAILIKDNHVAAAGGVVEAVRAARCAPGPRVAVQVEVDTLAQLAAVLDAGVDAVLLDNMPPATVADAVRLTRAHARGADCWIEASGGITLANVRAYADAGVDTISVGALTHSAPSVDIALDFVL
ncbi:MAG: carboxylating nicotinate-nucleotide diphosphorylase [Acidobacteria bacterium]|nr:carboxylating nicotinate-nucleotide diphosphorylase [Acidobacteriota bacterium]